MAIFQGYTILRILGGYTILRIFSPHFLLNFSFIFALFFHEFSDTHHVKYGSFIPFLEPILHSSRVPKTDSNKHPKQHIQNINMQTHPFFELFTKRRPPAALVLPKEPQGVFLPQTLLSQHLFGHIQTDENF